MGLNSSPSASKSSGALVDKLAQAHYPSNFFSQAQEKPEEQTDNWDDDFEIGEGVNLSVSKLQAGDKDNSTSTSSTSDENTKTIKPNRGSPSSGGGPDKGKGKAKPPPLPALPVSAPIKEGDEEDNYDDFIDDFEEKVADFKVCCLLEYPKICLDYFFTVEEHKNRW